MREVQRPVTPDPAGLAVTLARVVRGAGVPVPTGATVVLGRALARVGVDRPGAVYWAGHAALVTRPEDRERYDAAFHALFGDPSATDRRPGDAATSFVPLSVAFDAPVPGGVAGADTGPDGPVLAVRYSRAETLRHRDFAAYTAAEHDESRRLMADLRFAGAQRRSRRLRRSDRGTRPDLRRTVRRALAAGGEPVHRAWRRPGSTTRRIVLLCDVSGSMEPYARAMVRFLHTAVAGRGRVEAFALGTRVTRITRELRSRDPDAAIAAAARRVADWSGGTRLGEGLRTFNDQWGVKGMARGAVVVVISDGWDRGDAALLGEQMARLQRVAHRVVWVNPLKATPGYAPLAAGMAAALPHVDEFVEGHSIAALEALAALITR